MNKFILIISISAFSFMKAQSHELKCLNIDKVQNPQEFYDKYTSEGGYENLTILEKTFKNSFFGSNDKNCTSIKIRIQTQSGGNSIMSDSKKYIPQENEIALFLEDDDRKAFVGTKQQMFFKVGNKIKNSIISKKLDGLKILSYIKCGMLTLKKMPIDDSFVETLENELK